MYHFLDSRVIPVKDGGHLNDFFHLERSRGLWFYFWVDRFIMSSLYLRIAMGFEMGEFSAG